MAGTNNNSSTGKLTEAAEPQPLPTAEPVVLSCALQAAENGIGPDGISVLGRLADEKIAGLPEGYLKRQLVLQETTNDNIQPDFIHRVVSIPPKYVDRPDDPDGHAECIITTDDEKRLFDCPPFLTERVPHAKPDTITIKESATGGLGMFATRDIAYAELLVAERPLLVAPGVHRSDFHLGKCRTLEEHIKNMSLEREQQLESAFERMDDEKKEAYMALASSIKKDGLLSGIHQTNAFRLDLNELTKYGGMVPESEELRRGLMPQELNMYSFVVKTASRLNHSCSPNAELDFSLGSSSLQFHASRDIKAGEEIFISYTDEYLPAVERRRRLAWYGFTCVCTACLRATPESDKFRQTSASEMKILNARYHIAKEYDQLCNTGMYSVQGIILPKVLEFRRKLREEGLGSMIGPYLRSTFLLHGLYGDLGMFEEPEAMSVKKDMMAWMTMKAGFQGQPLPGNGVVTLKVPKL